MGLSKNKAETTPMHRGKSIRSPNQRRAPNKTRNGRRNHPRAAHGRDHLSVSRHRSGAHQRIERTVRCEIEDALPVGERELQVFAALLGSSIERLLAD